MSISVSGSSLSAAVSLSMTLPLLSV